MAGSVALWLGTGAGPGAWMLDLRKKDWGKKRIVARALLKRPKVASLPRIVG